MRFKKNNLMPLVVMLMSMLLMVGWMGYTQVNEVAHFTDDLYEHPFAVATTVLRIHVDIDSINRNMRDIVLASSYEEIMEYSHEIEKTEARIVDDFQFVKTRFLGDPAMVQEALQAFLAWKPERDQVIALALEGRQQDTMIGKDVDSDSRSSITRKMNRLIEYANGRAKNFHANAVEARSRTLAMILSSIIAATLFSLSIFRQVFQINATLRDINERLDAKVKQSTKNLLDANEQLRVLNEAIITTNKELEQRVDDRTTDLMAMNQELRATEEELRAQNLELQEVSGALAREMKVIDAVFNSVPGMIYLYDDQGKLIRWNKKHEDMTGYSAEELSQKQLLDWYAGDEETIAYISKQVQRVYQVGIVDAEANLLKKDGSKIPMYFTAVPVQIEDKMYFTGIGIDITARKMSEALALIQTEGIRILNKRISLATDSAGIGIWEWDLRTDRVIGDETMFALYGFSEKDSDNFIFETWNRLVHPDDRELFFQTVRQALCGQKEYDTEFRIVWSDGSIHHLKAFAQIDRDEKGEPIRMTGVNYDITQVKEAEAGLRESQERYQSLLQQSSEAFMVCEMETGYIVEVNAACTRMFGYTEQELLAMNIRDMTFYSETELQALGEELRKEGTIPACVARYRHKKGNIVYAERRGSLITYRNQLLILVGHHDITEERKLQEKIQADVKLAGVVQKAMLPPDYEDDKVLIRTIYQPVQLVSGDHYDYRWSRDGMVLNGFVLDITGHGMATALLTATIGTLFNEAMARENVWTTQTLERLNAQLTAYLPEGSFAAVMTFSLNFERRTFTCVAGGINYFLASTRDNNGLVILPGSYLGVTEAAQFGVITSALQTGDKLYFLTDGIIDRLTGEDTKNVYDFDKAVAAMDQLAISNNKLDDCSALCIQVKRVGVRPVYFEYVKPGEQQNIMQRVIRALDQMFAIKDPQLGIVVGEALANAVKHGSSVRIKLNMIGKRLIIRVKDDGAGFAGNEALKQIHASGIRNTFLNCLLEEHGRGVPLMMALTDRALYSKKGNEIMLIKKQ